MSNFDTMFVQHLGEQARRPFDADLKDFQVTIAYLESELSKKERIIHEQAARIAALNDEIDRLSLDLKIVRG